MTKLNQDIKDTQDLQYCLIRDGWQERIYFIGLDSDILSPGLNIENWAVWLNDF